MLISEIEKAQKECNTETGTRKWLTKLRNGDETQTDIEEIRKEMGKIGITSE